MKVKTFYPDKISLRNAIFSQLILLATLVVCVIFRPRLLLENYPISMFGNVMPTSIPFVFGFLMTAMVLWRAAAKMSKIHESERIVRGIFMSLAIVMVGLPITPYTVNAYFYYAHVSFAVIFYATALSAGFWFLRRYMRFSLRGVCLYAGIIAGIMGATLSTDELGVLHMLPVSQLLTIVCFSSLFIMAMLKIEETKTI